MKRENKVKKIYKNILLLMILILCTIIVIHDLYLIVIKPWVTGDTCGWTFFGFITFILAIYIGGYIIEYFIKKINK